MGVKLRYKYDHKLFRWYTRNVVEGKVTGCFFADDGVLPAAKRSGAERNLRDYKVVCTVSISKTMHLVTGRKTVGSDRSPIKVNNGDINSVDEFQFLGSRIVACGRMDGDVEIRIAQASRAFGALHKAVFMDKYLTLCTKGMIYKTCLFSVLLHGSGCWIPLREHIQKLNIFHHRYIGPS